MTRYWLLCGSLLLVASSVHAQSAPSPFTYGKRYDMSGRLVGEIKPDPDGTGQLHFRAVRKSYDPSGLVILEEQGELASWQGEDVAPASWTGFTLIQKTSYAYDQADRLIVTKRMDSAGTVKQLIHISYDVNGRQDCVAIRMDATKLNSAYVTACSQISTDAANPDRITRNYYDPSGLKMQVKQGVGTVNARSQVSYSRTLNGLVDTLVDANGNRSRFEYDGHQRLAKWTFPSTVRPTGFNDSSAATAVATAGQLNTSDFEQYAYDANGNRTSLRKRDGSTLTYQYDALNRMTVKVVPERAGLTAQQTRDIYYAYDLRGLATQTRFDSLSGEGLGNSYNGFGDLISSSLTMGGSQFSLSYSYDKNGNRVSVTHPDGQVFTYARDDLDRVSGIYEGTNLGSATQLIQAQYSAAGFVSSIVRSSASNGFGTTFAYDGIGRITLMANDATGTTNDLSITQSFNPANQISSQTRSNDAYAWTGSVVVNRNYTTNGLNQYTAAGPASFSYDPNGNLTSDGSTTFVYDVENRLVSASGAKSASLAYDPTGRLWRVTGQGTDTRFLYSGDELVAEYDSAGSMARRYVHADRADDPVVQYDGSQVTPSARTFLMPDERGSIVAMINNDGTSRATNSYDEYGIPGASNQGRFQYTGQAWLPELGMYHYKARIYSPTLGRFLQVDPIGYDDQYNLYAYVGDDPINKTDPTGTVQAGWDPPPPPKPKSVPPSPATPAPSPQSGTTTGPPTPQGNGGLRIDRTKQGQAAGTIVLEPQGTADGAPAQVTSTMQSRLLNLSEQENNSTVRVISGIRTDAQNQRVKDPKLGSQHLPQNGGNAADISIDGNTAAQTAQAAVNSGQFNRVALYTNPPGVHVDLKTTGSQGFFIDYGNGWIHQPQGH